VIVGGGFAGLGCAQQLADHDDVQVTLIDRNNYHQFQPLLYQVASRRCAMIGRPDPDRSNMRAPETPIQAYQPCGR
jgi:NADH:ubiquinone reductase (H+-translocating)